VLERERLAANIIVYPSAVEALQYLARIDGGEITDSSQIPSLVFVDLVMPEMTGQEFLEKFKSFSNRVKDQMKIVFFSGSMMNPEQRTELENDSSVLKYIPKPLQKRTLKELNWWRS
jgi:CheY-like chemotaxis protein